MMVSPLDGPEPGDPNNVQHGGDHYRATFQHWDWAVQLGVGYLLGCASKYVLRWRKKNGLEDLRKAVHYLRKYQSLRGRFTWAREWLLHLTRANWRRAANEALIAANELNEDEADIIELIAIFQVEEAVFLIERMIDRHSSQDS